MYRYRLTRNLQRQAFTFDDLYIGTTTNRNLLRDGIHPASLPTIGDDPASLLDLADRRQGGEIDDVSVSEVGVASVGDDVSALAGRALSFGEVVRGGEGEQDEVGQKRESAEQPDSEDHVVEPMEKR